MRRVSASRVRLLLLGSALTFLLTAFVAAPAWALPPWPLEGQVVQEIAEFDNPEGAVFSLDGQSLFVSNAAVCDGQPFGWTENGGYISKLSVNDDGTAQVTNAKLADGITAPLGMAVNKVATDNIPAGSVWIAMGSTPMATASGCEPVSDRSHLKTGVLIIDPDSGEELGKIDMSFGSVFHQIAGAPVLLSNAVTFDNHGNLYLADSGIGAGSLNPPVSRADGVWKIPYGSLDALAAGDAPPMQPQFIPISGGPDGIEASPVDDSIHTNTVGRVRGAASDPWNGGMWRLTAEDFANGHLPETYAADLGALDGLAFTASGTRIDTEIVRSGATNNIIISSIGLAHGQSPTGFEPHYLPLDQEVEITGPADVAVRTLSDGSMLLAVPELSTTSSGAGDDVTLIRLPANFDNPPNVIQQ